MWTVGLNLRNVPSVTRHKMESDGAEVGRGVGEMYILNVASPKRVQSSVWDLKSC